MAFIARTDGTRDIIEMPLSLEKARELLKGAYIEVVRPKASPDVVFLCDEDGLAKRLPLNVLGCELYGSWKNEHPIVGDIIVMTRKEAKGWR